MLFSSLGHSTKIDVRNLITEKYGSRYTKAWVKLAREIWPGMDVHTWRHYCNIHVNKYFSQEVAMRLLGHSGGRGKINEIYNIRDLEQLRKAVDMIP
jgi:integrase